MKFDGLSRIGFAALTAFFQQCGFGAVAVAKGFTSFCSLGPPALLAG